MLHHSHKAVLISVTFLFLLVFTACGASAGSARGASNALVNGSPTSASTSTANSRIAVTVHPYKTPFAAYVVGQAVTYDLATASNVDFGSGNIGAQWTIDWGDHTTPTQGSSNPRSSSFEVTGAHAYSKSGTYTITITVQGVGVFPIPTGNGTGVITVVNTAPSNQGVAVTVHPYQSPATIYAVGQAVNHDLATASSMEFGSGNIEAQWTIDWGDHTTPTQGSLSPRSSSFEIADAHAYSKSGMYTITITVKGIGVFPVPTGTGTGVISVVGCTLAVNRSTGIVGQTLQGIIATGTDPVHNDTLKGTVDWGDNTSASNVQVVSDGRGNYQVSASHIYSQAGTYTITVSLSSSNAGAVQGVATATIAPAFHLRANSISIRAGSTFRLNVATITGTVSLAGLKVEILWGDNNGSRLVINGGTGTIQIPAGHTYSQPGTYTISIAVKDLGTGEVEQAFGTATVTA